MRLRRSLITIALILVSAACGPRDTLTSSSAQATDVHGTHPLVATWQGMTAGQDLIVHSNGTTLSQFCGSQGTLGDIDESSDCGINSKACGSFPYIVINSVNDPACVEAGSYICYYNVYTASSQDYLALNCSDGKGVSYFVKQ